jgi:hypothetical protein
MIELQNQAKLGTASTSNQNSHTHLNIIATCLNAISRARLDLLQNMTALGHDI